jgi:hypothetical protein
VDGFIVAMQNNHSPAAPVAIASPAAVDGLIVAMQNGKRSRAWALSVEFCRPPQRQLVRATAAQSLVSMQSKRDLVPFCANLKLLFQVFVSISGVGCKFTVHKVLWGYWKAHFSLFASLLSLKALSKSELWNESSAAFRVCLLFSALPPVPFSEEKLGKLGSGNSKDSRPAASTSATAVPVSIRAKEKFAHVCDQKTWRKIAVTGCTSELKGNWGQDVHAGS